ncbi:MAG: ABC transporter substrate-binding protein [Marinobacter sp.]|uniref:ABC transporter substrate-binding protein n=1 Tax=Marinobacter sp. TaxID=50741 RepID=UPI00349FE509
MIETLTEITLKTKAYWLIRLAKLFVCVLLFSPLPALSQNASNSAYSGLPKTSILVAGSGNTAFNAHFMNLLNRGLGDSADISTYTEDRILATPNALVITLGSNALSQVQQQRPRPAILALMISEALFAGYLHRTGAPSSAIYNHLPLLQQALLGHLILPQASRIALLARPGTEASYDSLIESLSHFDLEVRVFTVESNDVLIATLSRALTYGDFLLATPDEMIFNPRTIKHILLTTYRRNRIIIGPNRAFVGAGALASTFVPLHGVVAKVHEQLEAYSATGKLLPPAYPRNFAVEVNAQVARSLNIPVPAPDILEARLKEQLSELAKGLTHDAD